MRIQLFGLFVLLALAAGCSNDSGDCIKVEKNGATVTVCGDPDLIEELAGGGGSDVPGQTPSSRPVDTSANPGAVPGAVPTAVGGVENNSTGVVGGIEPGVSGGIDPEVSGSYGSDTSSSWENTDTGNSGRANRPTAWQSYDDEERPDGYDG